MSNPPKRIQRRRTKGWRMPENAVYVGRGSKWGNPFKVSENPPAIAVASYRDHLADLLAAGDLRISELRGKDLACWCPLLDKDGNKVPCHADVLLELANAA